MELALRLQVMRRCTLYLTDLQPESSASNPNLFLSLTNTHKAYKPPHSCIYAFTLTSSTHPPNIKLTWGTSNHSHSVVHKQEEIELALKIQVMRRCTPYLTNRQPELPPSLCPKVDTFTFVQLCIRIGYLNAPSQHETHRFILILGTSNHSHSVIHNQEAHRVDWTCSEAPSDEKMRTLPHKSSTRIIPSRYPRIDTFTLVRLNIETNFSDPPSQHKTRCPLVPESASNHSYSLVHEQERTHDWACIKAPTDEKMHTLPYKSATRIISSPVAQNWHITLHTDSLTHSHSYTHTHSTINLFISTPTFPQLTLVCWHLSLSLASPPIPYFVLLLSPKIMFFQASRNHSSLGWRMHTLARSA